MATYMNGELPRPVPDAVLDKVTDVGKPCTLPGLCVLPGLGAASGLASRDGLATTTSVGDADTEDGSACCWPVGVGHRESDARSLVSLTSNEG